MRSIGATAVLAKAPAHAPATQSLIAFFGFLLELSVEGSGLGDGASIVTSFDEMFEIHTTVQYDVFRQINTNPN